MHQGPIKCGKTFEPFDPELVGQKRKIVIGKHSGKHALKHILEEMGFNVEEKFLAHCLSEVRACSIASGGALSKSQLVSIYEKIKLHPDLI